MRNIKSLAQPEEVENELLESIPLDIRRYAEMHQVESKFLNGLIRQLKPRRILEIGVAEGGSTCVLLNAIHDQPYAKVISVDSAEMCTTRPGQAIGFAVDMLYPAGNSQWSLYQGVDFSEVCQTFEERSFDFCVIDTAHLHPVESLNFLCALPYLTPSAVVVFHDLCLFTYRELSRFPSICLAPKLCFDTVAGDKIKPRDRQYLIHNKGLANIGAVQISGDTIRYIQNVFDMLYFPWSSYAHRPEMELVLAIIRRFYSQKHFIDLWRAYLFNISYEAHGSLNFHTPNTEFLPFFKKPGHAKLVIYGAGNACKFLLIAIKLWGYALPVEIWDRNETITAVDGIPVSRPPYTCGSGIDEGGTVIVIAIHDSKVVGEVKAEIREHYPAVPIFTVADLINECMFDEIDAPEWLPGSGQKEHLAQSTGLHNEYLHRVGEDEYRSVILYGALNVGVSAAEFLMRHQIKPRCFCDKKRSGFEPETGLPIISPGELQKNHQDAYIVITSGNYHEEIYRDLLKMGINGDRILSLEDYRDYATKSIPDRLLYGAEFHEPFKQDKLFSARIIVPHILGLVGELGQVVDFGCGTAEFLAEFKQRAGCEVLGVDLDYFNEESFHISKDEFQAHDLTGPVDLARRFDLAMSLETAEHLPEGSAAAFVQTLCKHSDMVLFCAAPPPQPGVKHINLQFPSYWAKLFEEQGFACVDCLRGKIWDDERICYFYRQSAMFFIKKGDALERFVARNINTLHSPPLDVWHPHMLRRYRDRVLKYLGEQQGC